MYRNPIAFLILTGATIVLAGCASGGSSYSDLDREPESSDALPAVIAEGNDQIEPETARLLGEYDGVTLWLIRGVENSDLICLGAMAAEDDWSVSCGGEGGVLGAAGPGGKSYKVAPDGMPLDEDGATQLTENVYEVDAL
ncbi:MULTISPECIES: hypothetical protein [unclassified Microbacterium]|uniref:hypothetical protein n=1 Tax=unclassified Microbacterium TaxID=2609290 RepID=UPI00300FAE80